MPFLNKAFLVDDPHFLAMAAQILKQPLHPMDFQVCWNIVENCMKAYALTPGNALMGYALVPTVLAGAHEWIAHLTQMFFAAIAIVAMSSLVLRLGWDRNHAMIGALLLVGLPPFLPMASTAMPDVLATAIALIAMERMAAWKTEQKWMQGVAAAIALGLAGFARSHLALLVPLAAFFLLDSLEPREMLLQIRRRAWLWSPVLAGGILLLVVILITRERSMALDPPPVFRGAAHLPRNVRSYLLYLAFPLPLAAAWLVSRRKIGRLRIAAAVVAAGVIAELLPPPRVVTFLAVIGFAALVDLLIDALRKRNHRELVLLLWILIPVPIVYYGHLPIKYLLPCVPAIILLCFELSVSVSTRVAKAAAICLIVAGTVYSLLILRSDAEFANFGRSAMYSLVRPEVAAGRTVWYTGNFSSYWYAGKAGAKLSTPEGPQPGPGDMLVVGAYEELGRPNSLARFPDRTLVRTISHTYTLGRTMGAGKGLYSNSAGNWLWGFGSTDWDRYELWRIDGAPSNNFLEKPPESR